MKVKQISVFLENTTGRLSEVIGIMLDDKPGGLAKVMDIFTRDGVNIEYLYSSLISEKESVVIIFRVEDIDHGLQIVEQAGLKAIAKF